MRTWQYVEPNVNGSPMFVTITDSEILNIYYDYWCDRMTEKFGRAWVNRYTAEDCIQDFVTVHWAWEI